MAVRAALNVQQLWRFRFVSERFHSLVGFVQTRPNLVDRAEHRQVVDSDIRFSFVFFQKSLDNQHFLVDRILRRILRQEFDLSDESFHARFRAIGTRAGPSFA